MTACPYSGRPAGAGDAAAPGATGAPDAPLPLYGPEFSANPRATYDRLRARGAIAPVEITPGVYGMLTTTYRSALHLLRNTPDRFAKDPRHWRALRDGTVPPDSPAATMMGPRDNALWLDGPAHARLRQVITDSLARVDTHALVGTVGRIADRLIDDIAPRGEADLVADFAEPLPLQVLIELFGSPPELGRTITEAVARVFDAGDDAAEAMATTETACLELTRLKRRRPGADVTSWMCAHPARLSDAEMVQQLLLVIGAGATPSTNLISNAALLLIDDERFSGDVFTGVRPVNDALEHVLWEDPPIANYCPLYAREPETYEGVTIEPGVPVLVSFAAANSDPALAVPEHRRAGNRAHLAYSAGVHGCPAADLARTISETAIERLLDRLPDVTLACPREELSRRPGTFHSGWLSLPVTFPTPATTQSTSRPRTPASPR